MCLGDEAAAFVAVIPAKAGIQFLASDWIPAFAGMTPSVWQQLRFFALLSH